MIARTVHVLVPAWIDDVDRVSGGNVYDRELIAGLRLRGWTVISHEVVDAATGADALLSVPDGALALVDGLVAGWMPGAIEAVSDRIRMVLLAHMVASAFPGASSETTYAELRAVQSARRVVVTSRWTADELTRRTPLTCDHTTIARPGVHAAPTAVPSRDGDLICVGVIAPHKGQDLLLQALARLHRTDWTCLMAGSMVPFDVFARRVAENAAAFDGNVTLPGVLNAEELEAAYRRSSLLIAPSRLESSGMAIAEARARGIPVLAAAVGGIPDTLSGGGAILVDPDDEVALAGAIRSWLTDPALRDRLRREARNARHQLPRWEETAAEVEKALIAA
ncbi:glycosyltransferase family 4 protein [Humibacter ginsengisoli]